MRLNFEGCHLFLGGTVEACMGEERKNVGVVPPRGAGGESPLNAPGVHSKGGRPGQIFFLKRRRQRWERVGGDRDHQPLTVKY